MRRWVRAEAVLPAGQQVVRWRVTTDAQYLGRGVHVDDVQVRGGARVDGERRPELFTASNWVATNH